MNTAKPAKISFELICLAVVFCLLAALGLSRWGRLSRSRPADLELAGPGELITTSRPVTPALLRGIRLYPDDPFRFDFIIDSGDDQLAGTQLKAESTKLIKYFLASLAVPSQDLWVNLSPYEQDRVIPDQFGLTQMGQELLAQDYILKQLASSLIYPESELGKEFWDKVYQKVYARYGRTDIPVDTASKVWIVPDQAVVYQSGNVAFVGASRLKVMLEEDYLAAQDGSRFTVHGLRPNNPIKPYTVHRTPETGSEEASIASQVMKEIVLPAIEREVNYGENFASLRQVCHSLILATWFKRNFREGLLAQVYLEKNKIAGVDSKDKTAPEKIYNQYLAAFQKGVYDYIRQDYDPHQNQTISRRYFSGGFAGPAYQRVLKSSEVAAPDLARVVQGQRAGELHTVEAYLEILGNASEPPRQSTRGHVAQPRGQDIQTAQPEARLAASGSSGTKPTRRGFLAAAGALAASSLPVVKWLSSDEPDSDRSDSPEQARARAQQSGLAVGRRRFWRHLLQQAQEDPPEPSAREEFMEQLRLYPREARELLRDIGSYLRDIPADEQITFIREVMEFPSYFKVRFDERLGLIKECFNHIDPDNHSELAGVLGDYLLGNFNDPDIAPSAPRAELGVISELKKYFDDGDYKGIVHSLCTQMFEQTSSLHSVLPVDRDQLEEIDIDQQAEWLRPVVQDRPRDALLTAPEWMGLVEPEQRREVFTGLIVDAHQQGERIPSGLLEALGSAYLTPQEAEQIIDFDRSLGTVRHTKKIIDLMIRDEDGQPQRIPLDITSLGAASVLSAGSVILTRGQEEAEATEVTDASEATTAAEAAPTPEAAPASEATPAPRVKGGVDLSDGFDIQAQGNRLQAGVHFNPEGLAQLFRQLKGVQPRILQITPTNPALISEMAN